MASNVSLPEGSPRSVIATPEKTKQPLTTSRRQFFKDAERAVAQTVGSVALGGGAIQYTKGLEQEYKAKTPQENTDAYTPEIEGALAAVGGSAVLRSTLPEKSSRRTVLRVAGGALVGATIANHLGSKPRGLREWVKNIISPDQNQPQRKTIPAAEIPKEEPK